MRGIEEEYGDRVEFEWRSFLLRPSPQAGRSHEKFVHYTNSWKRPGAEDDAGTFRVWETEHGPPSHSIPPHLLVKAAARCGGPERASAVSERLFEAYFAENLDITDLETMKTIWRECGLEPADFEHTGDEDLLQQVLEEHREAMKFGVNGVPAIMLEGNDVAITGAHPRELYRRWIDRTIAAREAGE
ncbi:MAG: DsbA family protein [Deltaproteobacteria bacterium]|nr:DsbA family protein [Deltaproteobacteria bacterium]MBW2390345.1 DsbA family protein [Deltaproteobacteria bacterium]MBW2725435.1 DsbA family protein [Deltaproteobacteria bacterium]